MLSSSVLEVGPADLMEAASPRRMGKGLITFDIRVP